MDCSIWGPLWSLSSSVRNSGLGRVIGATGLGWSKMRLGVAAPVGGTLSRERLSVAGVLFAL